MKKSGMHRDSGELIAGEVYLQQRLHDLFSFAAGDAPGFRFWGASLRDFVDAKLSETDLMRIYERITAAITDPKNGLDDFELVSIKLEPKANHRLEILVAGRFKGGDQVQTGVIL